MIVETVTDHHDGERRRFDVTTSRGFELNENGSFRYLHVKLFDYPDNDENAFASLSGGFAVAGTYARDEYKAFVEWNNPNDYGWDNY